MDATNHCIPTEHRLSRRQWLCGAGGLFLGAGSLATHATQTAMAEALRKQSKQVLFIWLDGGISQLESWDPKPNTRFGGPFRAIPTSVPGIHISELLPHTAKQMHHLALIRSLSTQDNAHSSGVDRIQRGDPKNRGVTYPFFGSAVAKLLGPGDSGLPPYLWIKPMNGGFIPKDAGFLGPQYGALALGDGKPPENLFRPDALSASEDAQRNQLRQAWDRRYAARRRPGTADATSHVFEMAAQLQKHQHIFDPSTTTQRDRDRYGPSDLGRHLLIARRMIEAGITFVKVTSYGWDSHGDHFNGQLSLMSKFDQGFSALVEDLAERSMLDSVLVIVLSEFGRTPRINGHIGRDHWPEAWSMAMTGPRIQRGVAIGKTNPEGTWVTSDEHDIGHLFHTWFASLGIDSQETSYDNGGQPLPIAHEDCIPISEVMVSP
ncbi:DUF1501 domain-containing protein [Tuwongella immobilis]|uniref:DUF1501 domain-containing protein n=1 Tax=Tuwongella immobilis TaxID=692036 RepID=A0A6C2YQ04_9BACT|nr:DUF1501 domain-containing protein [Tuwongella immobilis]VIP03427.1 hypothetical protein : Uncharacterized protein OS=Pirellula staleyi (strain ATCC 27377 / DSM 6068 / ICPB 4128) GN=Psta_1603 PE=4 SV=1: DUF1501 [Tuwongella immobilis]VTS04226.1 hypothetical protein : Uncharacterized protein OS=Pirellula staleyi (strain ATCC 27377 / DSM 6068 / ICPB 4128) GN=Psta_1603 PE=4 SV=1: DUF1501 [Tuwongella immobilis]